MAEKINVMFSAQVVGGPSKTAAQTIEVEAYDKLQITVESGDNDKLLQLQPGGAGQVMFLLITTDKYDDLISYKVGDAAGPSRTLNGPLLLIGTGATAMLGDQIQDVLFSSGRAEEAVVDILVGRDATP